MSEMTRIKPNQESKFLNETHSIIVLIDLTRSATSSRALSKKVNSMALKIARVLEEKNSSKSNFDRNTSMIKQLIIRFELNYKGKKARVSE